MKSSSPLTRVHAAIVKANPLLGEPMAVKGYTTAKLNQLAEGFVYQSRMITIADVLRAIEKRTARDDWRMPYWFGLDTDGHSNARFTQMYGDGKNEGYELTRISWNLKMDSLDAQSPETISFLEGILCK